MRAYTVCVNYADELSLSLPRARWLFNHFTVITTPTDFDTLRLATQYECETYVTECFYEDGGPFRKYRAIEQAIERWKREGWIALLDADVLLPAVIPGWDAIEPGNLYGMPRRMCADLRVPHESRWDKFPLSINSTREIPGYFQLFHASDAHLPDPPWFEDVPDCGAADSYFCRNWPKPQQVRFDCECLHVGPNRTHWQGRKKRTPAAENA